MISEWISRFRFFLRRDLLARRRTSEFDEELQFHVAQVIAAKMAQGMTPEEAREQYDGLTADWRSSLGRCRES
jgi:hypothetical protein